MRILICFDAPVEGRGVINGHAFHEVKELTEPELRRVCVDQRALIQKSLADSTKDDQNVPTVQRVVLRSVHKLDEESRILVPR